MRTLQELHDLFSEAVRAAGGKRTEDGKLSLNGVNVRGVLAKVAMDFTDEELEAFHDAIHTEMSRIALFNQLGPLAALIVGDNSPSTATICYAHTAVAWEIRRRQDGYVNDVEVVRNHAKYFAALGAPSAPASIGPEEQKPFEEFIFSVMVLTEHVFNYYDDEAAKVMSKVGPEIIGEKSSLSELLYHMAELNYSLMRARGVGQEYIPEGRGVEYLVEASRIEIPNLPSLTVSTMPEPTPEIVDKVLDKIFSSEELDGSVDIGFISTPPRRKKELPPGDPNVS